jgi:SAM-dependent methyltransferase
MGYAADYFEARVGSWIAAGWLPRSGKVADFGVQEFHGDETEAKRVTGQFLRRQGVAEQRIDQVCSASGPLSVGSVYHALGIDYVALDIQQGSDVRLFDLNCFAPPPEWPTAFDLINNEGAIEHLINPINGFQVAHELLKIGGVAVHSIPLSGHANHGLMYPTIKFYNRLLGANSYELLLAEISIGPSQPLTNERFVLRDRQGHPIARRVDLISAWLRLAYRKTTPAEFRSPFSHWADDQSGSLADRVNADYAAFARYRLTERGGPAAIPTHGTGNVQLQAAAPSVQTTRVERTQVENFSYEERRKLQIYEHEHEDASTRDHQRREHEHSDVLAAKLQQLEHEHYDVLLAKLQQLDDEHSDALLATLQQREHEHSDALAAKLQQREHEHSDALASKLQQREDQRYLAGAGSYLPLVSILLTSLLNGGALLIGLSHGSTTASGLFAAGLLSGFFPTVTAWTNFAGNPSPMARAVRHGARALWLLSAILFALGCLAAGPK